MNKVLTIITCARNEEKNISKLIINIQNQSYKDFNHIIVDDNSTDRTSEIVKSFSKKDKRFILKKCHINIPVNIIWSS